MARRTSKPAEAPRPPTRGGRRPGAGRPVVYTDLTDYHVYIDTAAKRVVEQRMADYAENFSEAVRNIIALYETGTRM